MNGIRAILALLLLASMSELTNAQPTFTELDIGLPGIFLGPTAWGDYDNDGDLDLAITGTTGMYISRVYRNNGDGTFTDIKAGLAGVAGGGIAWGDYDNDGNLDLAVAGGDGTNVYTL